MAVYYINSFYLDSVEPTSPAQPCIGLFTDENWVGKGTFCGWYGVEYYQDTTLLAYYHTGSGCYHPKEKLSDTVVCKKKLKQIPIGSCIWTIELHAENDDDAIRKFSELDFVSRY